MSVSAPLISLQGNRVHATPLLDTSKLEMKVRPPGHLRGLRAHSTEEKLMATNAATKNITEAMITEQLQFKAQKAESKVGKKVFKQIETTQL